MDLQPLAAGETTLWSQTLTADNLPEAVTVTLELVPRSIDGPAIEETRSATFAPQPRAELVTDVTLLIPPLAGDGNGAYLPAITVTDADTGEPLATVVIGRSAWRWSSPTAGRTAPPLTMAGARVSRKPCLWLPEWSLGRRG